MRGYHFSLYEADAVALALALALVLVFCVAVAVAVEVEQPFRSLAPKGAAQDVRR